LYFPISTPEDYEDNEPRFEIQNFRNETVQWLSIVQKGGGYYFKVDERWVTHKDHGENIFTVSLYDDWSADPKSLYPISFTIDYIKYDMVGEKETDLLSLEEIQMLPGPDP